MAKIAKKGGEAQGSKKKRSRAHHKAVAGKRGAKK
jgi:hypothetical protein